MDFATRYPLPDADGHTPADLARAAGHLGLAELLTPDEDLHLPNEGASGGGQRPNGIERDNDKEP
jgi:hypothetical protein